MPAQRWDPLAGLSLKDVQPFSRDRLMLVPRSQAAKMAFQMLHEVQGQSPEIQMAGLATLFAIYCKRHRLDPQDLYRLGTRLITPEPHHDSTNAYVEAVEDYARNLQRSA